MRGVNTNAPRLARIHRLMRDVVPHVCPAVKSFRRAPFRPFSLTARMSQRPEDGSARGAMVGVTTTAGEEGAAGGCEGAGRRGKGGRAWAGGASLGWKAVGAPGSVAVAVAVEVVVAVAVACKGATGTAGGTGCWVTSIAGGAGSADAVWRWDDHRYTPKIAGGTPMRAPRPSVIAKRRLRKRLLARRRSGT